MSLSLNEIANSAPTDLPIRNGKMVRFAEPSMSAAKRGKQKATEREEDENPRDYRAVAHDKEVEYFSPPESNDSDGPRDDIRSPIKQEPSLRRMASARERRKRDLAGPSRRPPITDLTSKQVRQVKHRNGLGGNEGGASDGDGDDEANSEEAAEDAEERAQELAEERQSSQYEAEAPSTLPEQQSSNGANASQAPPNDGSGKERDEPAVEVWKFELMFEACKRMAEKDKLDTESLSVPELLTIMGPLSREEQNILNELTAARRPKMVDSGTQTDESWVREWKAQSEGHQEQDEQVRTEETPQQGNQTHPGEAVMATTPANLTQVDRRPVHTKVWVNGDASEIDVILGGEREGYESTHAEREQLRQLSGDINVAGPSANNEAYPTTVNVFDVDQDRGIQYRCSQTLEYQNCDFLEFTFGDNSQHETQEDSNESEWSDIIESTGNDGNGESLHGNRRTDKAHQLPDKDAKPSSIARPEDASEGLHGTEKFNSLVSDGFNEMKKYEPHIKVAAASGASFVAATMLSSFLFRRRR